MITRAPGKIVLSGAYAVLEGAPSIVAAVDRYVTADASRPATFLTPEVAAALDGAPAPWFDATALRSGDQKLGLGSSAAILVASLAALAARDSGLGTDEELAGAVFAQAFVAHRKAQGGGSGIDVAASTYGGTLVARRTESGGLLTRPARLPPGLVVDVLFAGVSASTPDLIGRVKALRENARGEYAALLGALGEGAEAAARALDDGSADGLLEALSVQLEGFRRLGARAGAPIVTEEVDRLAVLAGREGALVLPAGAGGGDVALFLSRSPASADMVEAIAAERHVRLDLELEARGVHLLPRNPDR